MSKIVSGLVGVTTVALTLGLFHFEVASGNGLAKGWRQDSPPVDRSLAAADMVNRVGKADRTGQAVDTGSSTIAVRLKDLDTSVLIQILPPSSQASGQRAPAPPIAPAAKKTPAKMPVACEPLVSPLTEVARYLQPGRCIT